MFETEVRRVRLTFISDVLGTQPANKNLHEDFISSKAPDAETREEELEHIPAEEMVKKEKTIFYRDPVTGEPQMEAYQIRGFLKGACGFLRKSSGTKSSGVKAYKKAIDGAVFVYPDVRDRSNLWITIKNAGEITDCQRPLRAQTAQGERVALANSECIKAGATLEFDIELLKGFKDAEWGFIEELLSFGVYNGLGQWRNSGKGAFVWEYC